MIEMKTIPENRDCLIDAEYYTHEWQLNEQEYETFLVYSIEDAIKKYEGLLPVIRKFQNLSYSDANEDIKLISNYSYFLPVFSEKFGAIMSLLMGIIKIYSIGSKNNYLDNLTKSELHQMLEANKDRDVHHAIIYSRYSKLSALKSVIFDPAEIVEFNNFFHDYIIELFKNWNDFMNKGIIGSLNEIAEDSKFSAWKIKCLESVDLLMKKINYLL